MIILMRTNGTAVLTRNHATGMNILNMVRDVNLAWGLHDHSGLAVAREYCIRVQN